MLVDGRRSQTGRCCYTFRQFCSWSRYRSEAILEKLEPKVTSTSHNSNNKNKFHTTRGWEGGVLPFAAALSPSRTIVSPLSASHAPYWRRQVCFRVKEQQKFPFPSNSTVGEPIRQRAQSSALTGKAVPPSLEILSCTFLDPVSKTTARGSFSWSGEKGLARLKRTDFGGMQDSSPGLRPGGDDVTTSAREGRGWGGRGGARAAPAAAKGAFPSPRQGRWRDK